MATLKMIICRTEGRGYLRQHVLSSGKVLGSTSLQRKLRRILACALTTSSEKCRPSSVCDWSSIWLNTRGKEISLDGGDAENSREEPLDGGCIRWKRSEFMASMSEDFMEEGGSCV